MLVITKVILRATLNTYCVALQHYNVKNDSYHKYNITDKNNLRHQLRQRPKIDAKLGIKKIVRQSLARGNFTLKKFCIQLFKFINMQIVLLTTHPTPVTRIFNNVTKSLGLA